MKTNRGLYAHTRHRRAAARRARARASAPHTRATRAGGVDPSAPRSHAPERAGGDARRGVRVLLVGRVPRVDDGAHNAYDDASSENILKYANAKADL